MQESLILGESPKHPNKGYLSSTSIISLGAWELHTITAARIQAFIHSKLGFGTFFVGLGVAVGFGVQDRDGQGSLALGRLKDRWFRGRHAPTCQKTRRHAKNQGSADVQKKRADVPKVGAEMEKRHAETELNRIQRLLRGTQGIQGE